MIKKYRILITESAENDIFDIYDYIKLDNISAAKKWKDSLQKQILSLKQHPFRCPELPENEKLKVDYRHIIYGNYRIIYMIIKKEVIILRVIHGARLLNQNYFQ